MDNEQLSRAAALDAADPLGHFRDRFHYPRTPRHDPMGQPVSYLCGNSLGLQSVDAADAAKRVLARWEALGVEGHFPADGSDPEAWYRYDEPLAELMAPIVGAARASDVALFDSLTVNLHRLMASFYRPSGRRTKILIEPHAFPSDRYAVETQAKWHGLDPETTVVEIPTASPHDHVTPTDVEACIAAHADQVALVLVGGINYFTGQLLDIAGITEAGHRAGAMVGVDLAHAAGNVPLELSAWDVDFAAWCTYKYLNSGPGGTAGVFVNQRHGDDPNTLRLAGWWGNDPDTRFDMHGQASFVPKLGAAGWKISNQPPLAMAPLGASLKMFAEAGGMLALRAKSLKLTAFLEEALREVPNIEMLTPTDPEQRGCQLSIRVPVDAATLEHQLSEKGVIVDARDPDVIRFAPAPLYNGWVDVVRAVSTLRDLLPGASS